MADIHGPPPPYEPWKVTAFNMATQPKVIKNVNTLEIARHTECLQVSLVAYGDGKHYNSWKNQTTQSKLILSLVMRSFMDYNL